MIKAHDSLPILFHSVEQVDIGQRAIDGYVNATALCKAAGKLWGHYWQTQSAKDFVQTLSSVIGIPITELVQVNQGGIPQLQGTWIHPYIAINLAQWLSPVFAVEVSRWVHAWMSGSPPSPAFPDHIRRYMVNQGKVPNTHFSMLNQMVFKLLGPLEQQGYIVPAKLMPDIALGKMFSRHLRELGYNPDEFPTYSHEFLDHRPTVRARLYPNALITDFNELLENWVRTGKAKEYLAERDPLSVEAVNAVYNFLVHKEKS